VRELLAYLKDFDEFCI